MPLLVRRREQDFSKGQRRKLVAVGLVKFVLKLDPVQPQRVQEALEHVHGEEHRKGRAREHPETAHNQQRVARVDGSEHGLKQAEEIQRRSSN